MKNYINQSVSRKLLSGLVAVSFLFLFSCQEQNDDSLTTLGALALNGQNSPGSSDNFTASDGIASVPSSLTGDSVNVSGAMASVRGGVRTVITDQTASEILSGVFAPVRESIKVCGDIQEMARTTVDKMETVIAEHRDDIGEAVETMDGDIATINESTTFGEGGYKLEIWGGTTHSSFADEKFLELDYRVDEEARSIDGILFLKAPRDVPDGVTDLRENTIVTIRLEFRRGLDSEGLEIKNSLLHLQNVPDPQGNPSNAAFFIEENSDGVVTIDGAQMVTGVPMPFADVASSLSYTDDTNRADTTSWNYDTQRSYTFTASGSEEDGVGVVKAIFPLVADNDTVAVDTDQYGSNKEWGFGELFTDGVLQQWTQNAGSAHCEDRYPGLDYTTMDCINADFSASLTTESTQEELSSVLTTIQTEDPENQFISTLQGVVSIENPAYFLSTTDSNILIGQEDITDLDTVPGVDDATVFTTYENLLRSTIRDDEEGGSFLPANVAVIDVVSGTSIEVLSTHTTALSSPAWSGVDDTVPE